MGLETGEYDSDSVGAEVDSTTSATTITTTTTSEHDPLGDYLKLENEYCDTPHDRMSDVEDMNAAATECSNNPSCTQFYQTKGQFPGQYYYYTCYEPSKIFDSEAGPIIFRKKCNGDEDCGSDNSCHSGQCYKFRQNQYCYGNRLEENFYPDIETASKVCSQDDHCRCMQDTSCNGNEIFLYSLPKKVQRRMKKFHVRLSRQEFTMTMKKNIQAYQENPSLIHYF